ncbi:S41 family peptidase [Chelativorans salis]|uniref:S41 family peptidase n=1 Tax=Chelativorans salis TaxID=2978478 RepID=A0ABT2LIS3_9HYPH|nr:S41 family peptidase [Chelativorans sp. EGI FJ00035]MCT7373722.1 S41 family peptidase [Chelativorans sp. EGI FJ00035]
MKAKTLGLFTALLLLLTPVAALADDPPQSGQPVFDRIVELVMERFYDATALDRFAAAVRDEIEDHEAPLRAGSSEARVDAAIDAVLASLNVSHTGRYKPDGIDYFELIDIFRFAVRDHMRRLFPPEGEASYHGIGMVAQELDGTLFVSDVYDGSPADRAGILAGDEIVSVDGAPYQEIESFRDKAGETVEVRLRRNESAEPFTVEVTVERLRPLRSFSEAIEESATVTEHDGQRIGYVRLWTLASRDAMDIVARELAAGRLEDADGVIVDLRGRWGGGRSDAAELFVGGTAPFRLIPRSGEEILANVRWNRPVVAIIDEGSRSGLEVFAYSLKTNGIPLVGARTAGALLAGRGYLLPDDSLLVLAVSDAVIGEDTRLEGRGIGPDVPVSFSLPYSAGRDPQRDAAIVEMRRILAED